MDDKMNKHEADLEAWKYGGVEFVHPGDGPDNTPGRDNPEFNARVVDLMELQSVRAAMKLCQNVMAWSRTPRAGLLRIMAIEYILFGEPSVDEIAFRMDVKRRRVFQAIREVRGHCEPLIKIRSGIPL
jgi:hypothetical protein